MLKPELTVLAQDWANMPVDIVDNVLRKLSTADSWKTRQISRSWARRARQAVSFEIVLEANRRTLLDKVRILSKRRVQQRLPNVCVTFRLTGPLFLQEFASLLRRVKMKVRKCIKSLQHISSEAPHFILISAEAEAASLKLQA